MEVKSIDYQFANRLWVDVLFGSFRSRHSKMKVVLFSVAPWLIGFIIAIVAGYWQAFVETGAFYLGSIGIFVTTWMILYASTKQYDMYDRFLDCFDISVDERLQLIKVTIERYSNWRLHLRGYVFALLLAELFIAVGFFGWDSVTAFVQQTGLTLLRPEAFESNGWYREDAAETGFTIVTVYSIFLFWPLATAISVIGRMPIFMIRTAKLPTSLPPRLVKSLFSTAAGFYTRVSLVWAFGVILFILLFVGDDDWLSTTILVALFVFGLLVFIVPQVAYARVIASSEQACYGSIMSELDSKRSSIDEMMAVVSRYPDFFMAHDTWVYPIHQTYVVVLGYALSIISLNHINSFYKLLSSAG
ncbi:MAG: hypothetical protein GXP16_15820 [Gammaproteobacteria bacterium]|nr:hypothetical protein [Gammaproteobacteria bacterium]